MPKKDKEKTTISCHLKFFVWVLVDLSPSWPNNVDKGRRSLFLFFSIIWLSYLLRTLSLKIVKNNVILTHQKATFYILTHPFTIYHSSHFYSIILYIEIIYTPPKATIIKPQNQLTTTTQPAATTIAQSLLATTTTNPSIFP